MKRSSKYSWPSTPLKRSPKKREKIKKLLSKLDNVAAADKDKSNEINTLKSDIINLTTLE